MSVSKAANVVEKLAGHDGSSVTQQDVANYSETGDPSQTMKALVWQGKNKVEMGMYPTMSLMIDSILTEHEADVPRPKIIEDRDVILRVTGSTVCGSDLHLLHGAVVQLQAGDILGHEFCGVVDEVGSAAKGIEVGKRYVASFQIACGDCFFCKQKLSSQCEKTNSN